VHASQLGIVETPKHYLRELKLIATHYKKKSKALTAKP
jgi:hypothetical protein